MSLASDFEDMWNARDGRIPKTYYDLTAMIISIDRDFDVRVKDNALMITFSDGSCVHIEPTWEKKTTH